MMKISTHKKIERDEYCKNQLLRYIKNKKMIALTETIFCKLDVNYETSDELIEIKEYIRETYEELVRLDELRTLASLKNILRAEHRESQKKHCQKFKLKRFDSLTQVELCRM